MSENSITQGDVKKLKTPARDIIKKIPTNPKLQHFETAGGPFGWFAHGVTGEELNRFANDIQQYLIEAHENNIELRDMYEQLIWDLGEFDKRYLQSNLDAVKASEKACEETRKVRKEMDEIIGENKKLKSKLHISYWIAGVSIILAVAAFVMHFIRLPI